MGVSKAAIFSTLPALSAGDRLQCSMLLSRLPAKVLIGLHTAENGFSCYNYPILTEKPANPTSHNLTHDTSTNPKREPRLMPLISLVRGMRDLLPEDAGGFRRAEAAAAECFAGYDYGEIRTPIVERTELFQRQLGEHSDIVQKEIYAFEDRSGDPLCLRPEATVPTVRAIAAASLHRGTTARMWYCGPMFRRERPQKGRYRQFWQIGAEAVAEGAPDPAIDAEQICMADRLWRKLQVHDRLQLWINNLGRPDERAVYRKTLSAYFADHADRLDEAARARIHDNPMRILDSKDADADIIRNAPPLADCLSDESRAHVENVKSMLSASEVQFRETPHLVRGLDYYNLTVFEWTLKDDSRRQNAVCGGGRYDGLSAQIGGPDLHGCGFALGLDRLVSLMAHTPSVAPDCYVVAAGASDAYVVKTCEALRDIGLSVRMHSGGGTLTRQLKKAANCKATFAVILGEEEEQAQTVSVKRLHDGLQQSAPLLQAATLAAQLHSAPFRQNHSSHAEAAAEVPPPTTT